MDPEERQKSSGNVDDVMVVLRKHSKSVQARYTPWFKAFVNLQIKRQRVSHARGKTARSPKEKKSNSEHSKGQEDPKRESKHKQPISTPRNQSREPHKNGRMCKKCGKTKYRVSFWSRFSMHAPKDQCCCKSKRRRRSCKRRRTRSCRRRRKSRCRCKRGKRCR